MKKEPSAKRKFFLVSFFGALFGSFPAFLVVGFIVFLVLLFSHVPTEHSHIEGLYLWDPISWENAVEPESKREFFAAYPYSDGNYHGDYYDAGKNGRVRNFVWLTYDDPAVYEAAKQSHVETRLSDLSLYGEHEAYGFRFYTIGYNAKPVGFVDNWRKHVSSGFPGYFDAFGYNDETRTLIFLYFNGGGKREEKYIALGDSDFPAFLDHYYGDWFDWENGVGIHLPE